MNDSKTTSKTDYIKDKLIRLIEWSYTIVQKQPLVMLAIVVCFFAFSSFGEVVDDVMEGDTHRIDNIILKLMRDADGSPMGPIWIEDAMRDITALGSTMILILFTVASVVYLLIKKERWAALYLACTVITARILTIFLKVGFGRERPDMNTMDIVVHSTSFPSGHTTMATVVYLTLGLLLAEVQTQYRLKIYTLCFAALIVFLVGFSRMYLGVHWPSDVVAGWCVGCGWALLFWILAKILPVFRKDE